MSSTQGMRGSCLRRNDGAGATRAPIAVAAGARTLVGDGAPPSRMASVGRRPLGGAGNLEEGIRGSCLRRNDGRRSGVAHFGALWRTLGGTAARSTPARRVHRGGSRKTTAATGRPHKRSAGRMPAILCIRVHPCRSGNGAARFLPPRALKRGNDGALTRRTASGFPPSRE